MASIDNGTTQNLSDGIVELRGVKRDGKLVEILDKDMRSYGAPVFVKTTSGGGLALTSAGDQISGNAAPIAFASRALVAEDNGMVLTCATAQTATVNAGMAQGFGAAFRGAISFVAGSGVTLNDIRQTGFASPWCALVQTGLNQYDVIGSAV